MTDKTNNTPRSEQNAESIKHGTSSSNEQSGISDFVAGLLPKCNKDITDDMRRGGDKIAFLEKTQFVGADEKGVIELKTGDTLVRAGGHEVLMLKGGGHVVVKPDGSYEINTKDPSKVKYDAATGSTTIDMGGGRSVTLQDGHISSVDGDGKSAVMMQDRMRKFPNSIDQLPHHGHGSIIEGLKQLENNSGK